MVELSEKLVRPSLGALTGFVSASSGTGALAASLRPSPTLLASFTAKSYCVKRVSPYAVQAGLIRGIESR
jgi:hypothetical protein